MRILKLSVLWDSKQAEAGMTGLAAKSETTGASIAKSGETAGAKFSAGIESGATKAGNGLEKVGNSLGEWGIPFSNRITKIGKDLGNLETRGRGVAEAFSAVGGIATLALVGVGAEAVKISDQFETAQAGLQTSIKNAGGTWGQYKGQVDAAYASAAKLGFENNDVATGLQTLTSATNSPTKALNDLGTAENIARARHESLSDASGQLAKILGGNTRLLQQWGINLDVGSGKLKSIQSAEESLQKAQLSQTHIQDEVNDGQIKGVNASYDLANAKLTVRNAELNLQQSQKAIPEILDAINQRTQGMATAYGKTLPGELQTARAELHNIGTTLGTELVPDIDKLLGLGGDVLGFFDHSTAGATALGVAIGGPLAAAIALFTYNRVVNLVTGLQKMGSSFISLAATVLEKTGVINVAAREQAAIEAQTTAAITAGYEAQTTAAQTAYEAQNAILAEQEAMYRQFGISTGESISDAASAFAGLDVAVGQSAASVDASLATMETGIATLGKSTSAELFTLDGEVAASATAIETSNLAAGASFTALLGPIALVAAAIAGVSAAASIGISKVLQLGQDSKQQFASITTDQTALNNPKATAAQKAAAAANLYVQGASPGSGKPAPSPSSIAGVGATPTQITARGQIEADTIAEKGLKGLALSAQKLQVSLDKIQANPNASQTAIASAQSALAVANAKVIAEANAKAAQTPNLGGTPAIGGGTGAGTSKLDTLLTSAHTFLAGLADEANPARGTSLASLRSKLNTDTDSKSKLAAKTLEDKLKAAGQTGLADEISKAFTEVGTDLHQRIVSAAKTATNLRHQKAGNALLGTLQGSIGATDIASAQAALGNVKIGLNSQGDNVATGSLSAADQKLINSLVATHKKPLENMATNIESAYKDGLANLNSLLANQQEQALTDQTQAAADQLGIQTTTDSNAAAQKVSLEQATEQKQSDEAANQTAIFSAMSQKITDGIEADTAAITDAAKIAVDKTNGTTQGITDQTQGMNDASAATVTAINDQTTLQVDQMKEQGLYGLQLIAQQDQVALDQQVLIDHQAEAAATAHLDSVTASTNQLLAADQLSIDTQQQTSDASIAADQNRVDQASIQGLINTGNAQDHADSVTIQGIIDVGNSQSHDDSVTLNASIANAAAQAHTDAMQWGTSDQQQAAQLNQSSVSATQSGLQATADASLSGAKDLATANNADASTLLQQSTDAANQSNAAAAATLQQDQAIAAKTLAILTASQSTDSANAAQTIALATQSLAQITDSSNITEARLQSLVTIANAAASGQFGGGGLVIEFNGDVKPTDGALIADTVQWAVRTVAPVPIGT